nr:DUF305 domain-containing protein [Euzebya rosea]
MQDVNHEIDLRTAESPRHDRADDDGGGGMGYGRFFAMIATSTVVMFLLMYLNTYAWGHIQWSETRAWMALLMGSVMSAIMIGFMWRMYSRKGLNTAIVIGSVIVFAGSLFLVRSQLTVDGSEYMKAMIPHHSIAVLTSTRADIQDVRVRQLADEIIRAQRREIQEMEWLIADIELNGVAETIEEGRERPVPEFEVENPPEGNPLD